MLQRIAAGGRALRQISIPIRNCSKSLFTSLTTTGATTRSARHSATGRGEADLICRPRAMMSNISAGPSQFSETGTYLDDISTPDVDFDRIKSTMTCTKFHDSIWGFVIYRCSQGNQAAWDRLLQALRSEVQDNLRYYIRPDLLEFHDLHVIDDKALYGATSHQVRDHFQSWVPKNLEDRVRLGATNLDDNVDWLYATSTPRYKYCLFVDDICLESVDQPGSHRPAVKLLCKDWESPYPPEERNYSVPAPFHDGATEYDEEDVGWMYMPLDYYIHKYDVLGKCDWDDQYVRPPYIEGFENEETFIGHWRQKSLSEEVKATSEPSL
ncbi:hypothetical protein LI328DRAFT_131475 [Trichoderma asperelloides]|nr:hypothetical protein LI328DRAFT_131475 [Trichoderma asperelloides]